MTMDCLSSTDPLAPALMGHLKLLIGLLGEGIDDKEKYG